MNAHPSQYALDRVALGAPVAPSCSDHVAGCPRCAEIVASRRAAPVRPAWLDTVRAPPARSARRSLPRRLGWAALLPAAVAALIAVALLPGVRDRRADDEEIRAKGVPQVAVYLKRAEAVVAWDGHTPVRGGDRLRLGIRAPGFTHVSVASLPPSPAAPSLLYSGELSPAGETLLPIAFRVDEWGSAEVLSVVITTGPVPPGAHDAGSRVDGRGAAWTTRITLPKETSR